MSSIANHFLKLLGRMPHRGKFLFLSFFRVLVGACGPFVTSALLSVVIGAFASGLTMGKLALPLLLILAANLAETVLDEKVRKQTFLFRLSLVADLIEKSEEMDIPFLESKEGKKAHSEARRAVLEGNNVGVEIFMNKILSLAVSVACVLAELAIICRVSVAAAAALLVTMGAILAVNYQIERKDESLQEGLAKSYGRLGELQDSAMDAGNQKDIRLYSVGGLFRRKLWKVRAEIDGQWDRSVRLYRRGEALSIAISLLRELALGLLLFRQFRAGGLGLPFFVFVMSSTVYFKDWQDSLLYDTQEVFQNNVIVSRFWEFMEMPGREAEGPTEASHSLPEEGLAGDSHDLSEIESIELRDVSFSYPDGAEALRGVSLSLGRGEKIALVGANGAGKTTLANILLGIYRPTSGEALVNGGRLEEADRERYRSHFSASFQKNIAFPFSIRENILCKEGRLETPEDERRLRDALRAARAEELVGNGEEGLDRNLTRELDDRGVELSGGQMQRLLLARTICQDRPIVLLDEPTSALDPIMESEIFGAYLSMMREKTAIFITHKLISVRYCDRIYVLSDGRIAESGTHEELMARKGAYHDLYEAQSRQYVEGGVGQGAEGEDADDDGRQRIDADARKGADGDEGERAGGGKDRAIGEERQAMGGIC